MNARLMTHMVAGFPSVAASQEIGHALIRGGSSYLEVQFPFSDPTADGPAIQEACTRALSAGFRVADGFSVVSALASSSVPVFIMGYASVVVAAGVEEFVARAADAGASGLIIPDLPVDSDEGLFAAGARHSLSVVPVVVPTMRDARLELVSNLSPPFVYAALRTGITGTYTTIGEENVAFLDRLTVTRAKVFAGFGIQDHAQVSALQRHVHAVVAGSVLVRTIQATLTSGTQGIADAVCRKTRELAGSE